ncbi:MAG: hypothetical protein GY884_15200, partial [Proteobacteria bacterium]|nr:hypothetical protein [Pseudomonadota bacterium]
MVTCRSKKRRDIAYWTAAVVGALVACGTPSEIEEGDFAALVADAACELDEVCFLGHFENEYSDRDECVDDAEEYWEDVTDDYDDYDCDYEEDEAASCLEAWRTVSCEDYFEY